MPYIGVKPENIIATAIDATTGTFSGAISVASVDADGGVTADNITIDGTEIDLSSGDLTLDIASDLNIDVDDGRIFLKDGGTTFGRLANASTDFEIVSVVENKDILFKGNDAGSEITALTLDMSASGDATFNSNITVENMFVAGNITHAGDNDTQISFTDNEITLDSGGDIVLDADGGNISFKDSGVEIARFIQDSQSLQIRATVNNKDIVLAGRDDSSTVNALTLDMSDAGTATFNHDVISNGAVLIGTTTEGNASADELTVAGTGNSGITIRSGTSNSGAIYFSDATSGAAEYAGYINYAHGIDSMTLGVGGVTALQIYSNGMVTKALQPAFAVSPASTQSDLAINTVVDIVFGTEYIDRNADFASNTFTAPVTGLYQLSVHIYTTNLDVTANYVQFNLLTSNRGYTHVIGPNFSSDLEYYPIAITALADMDAGDTAKVQFYQSGGAAQQDIITANFTGFLAC